MGFQILWSSSNYFTIAEKSEATESTAYHLRHRCSGIYMFDRISLPLARSYPHIWRRAYIKLPNIGGCMDEKYVFWRCENLDCRALNKIEREKIEEALKKGKIVALVCANCGFVNCPQTGDVFNRQGPDTWLPCIPFEGSERSLPTGRTPDGWKDYMGRTLSRTEFMKKYRIDPQINWEWRKKGSPKALD